MKLCDKCGIPDDNHHNAVGPVNINILGYHYKHWTHKGIPENWTIDLCPACTKTMKRVIDATLQLFKGAKRNV